MERVKNDNLDYRGKKRVQTVNTGDSLTVQSDAHLADIQNIMRSFGQEGMDILDEAALTYADVSDFTDLRDALDQAREAEVEFMKLPSKVREIFDHDVAVWLDTAHDKEKRDALVEAGFLKSDKAIQPLADSPEDPVKTPKPEVDGPTGTGSE